MTAFRTKWDDWDISDTPKCGTDRTDRRAFVSSVSAALGHIQPENCGRTVEIAICGQCAVVIKPDQEFLHMIGDGFLCKMHLDCYDAWFRDNIAGRYPD